MSTRLRGNTTCLWIQQRAACSFFYLVSQVLLKYVLPTLNRVVTSNFIKLQWKNLYTKAINSNWTRELVIKKDIRSKSRYHISLNSVQILILTEHISKKCIVVGYFDRRMGLWTTIGIGIQWWIDAREWNVGQNIPRQNITCHFSTPQIKHHASICHPGQNIPCRFCHPRENIPCHFCHPGQNIPCHFCHPGQNIPHSV